MSSFIGVDGGGTGTRAVILDEHGAELGRAEGPGGVVTRGVPHVAADAVTSVVREAAQRAKIDLPGSAMWAGLAGAGQDAPRTSVLVALVQAGLAKVVHVGTDVEAAFQAAFGDGPGVLLIAGTGSIAWARREDGARVRVGGWGQHLGDEGGGYWIGSAALRAVLRAEDGRSEATEMASPVLEHCGVDHARGLIGWVETASKGEIAALAPIVGHAADEGDVPAAAILDAAVVELVSHVEAVLEKLGPTDGPPRLVLWGGLLGSGGSLHLRTRAALKGLSVDLRDGEIDPPTGAANLARALL